MLTALNVNASVGLFFEDWVEISEGQTLEYEVSLYEDADLDKVKSSAPSTALCPSRMVSTFCVNFVLESVRGPPNIQW